MTFSFSLGGGPRVLFEQETPYNTIRVVDHPTGVRSLQLDASGQFHSLIKPSQQLTGAYWDEYALLPPLVPPGPVGILGLGGGCVARLYRSLWPERRLVAWELDEVVVHVARTYFALDPEVEVHVGDALDEAAEGGFAALLIDLYRDGVVPESLFGRRAWEALAARTIAGGRLMINLARTGKNEPAFARVLANLTEVFGDVIVKRAEGGNVLACTGPRPDPAAWRDAVPELLRDHVDGWVEADADA